MGITNEDATYGLDQGSVADIINTSGVQGFLTVSTSAVEAIVSVSRLTNRKLLTIHNDGPTTIYWGYTNTVTTATGTPIFKNQLATWDIGDGLGVWLIAGTAGNTVRVTEAS